MYIYRSTFSDVLTRVQNLLLLLLYQKNGLYPNIMNSFHCRNTLPRWTKQIRVTPGMGVEGPLDDGYSWRKYGQKDILGALYPR